MKLEKLHTDIADVLHRKTQLKTVLLYPAGRARVDVPAGLLELSEIDRRLTQVIRLGRVVEVDAGNKGRKLTDPINRLVQKQQPVLIPM